MDIDPYIFTFDRLIDQTNENVSYGCFSMIFSKEKVVLTVFTIYNVSNMVILPYM